LHVDKKSLRALLREGGPLPEGASPGKIVNLAETLWDLSVESAVAFLKASISLFPFLKREDITEGELLASGRIVWVEPSKTSSRYAEKSGPPPTGLSDLCGGLCGGWFHHLESWFEPGRKLAERLPEAATQYFQSTPVFLKYEKIFRAKQWAECALKILGSGKKCGKAAVSFFAWSTDLLEFMSFRELLDWNALGILITKKSENLASTYFSTVPKGMASLYRSERIEIFKTSKFLAEKLPEDAIAFYQRCPETLLDISPTVRKAVLEAVKKNSGKRPEKIIDSFEIIVSAIRNLSYPAQERVISNGKTLAKRSIEAARAYFRNVGTVLTELPDSFLDRWVETGLSFFPEDEKKRIDYFSLRTSEASEAISRWKAAVLLDDYQRLLSIFVQALSGKELGLKSTDELDFEQMSTARYYPTSDGDTIYLPSFVAEGKTPRENFRYYKVAAAHQAGYVEFGTFASGFSSIITLLESLPQKDLAMDIFYILEDGRIDRRLREEYRGIGQDLDLVLSEAMNTRPFLQELPVQEALVEALLRLSVGKMDERKEIPGISEHIAFLEYLLFGFYKKAKNVWDCFFKTLEIYGYLSRLPSRRLYNSYVPVPFRGKLDPSLFPAPDQMASLSVEGQDDEPEVPIPSGELKNILETLKDVSNLQVQDATEILSQGLFITDLEGATVGDESNNSSKDTREGWKIPLVAAISRSNDHEGPFYYDEWDYLQGDYRRRWCCLREKTIEPRDTGRIDTIYTNYRDLIQQVRKQFQRIRPTFQQIVRRVEWGDEIDLPAMIEAVVDRKTGESPSEKIFMRKEKKIRRISTALLVDMSASTDKTVPFAENANYPPGGIASTRDPVYEQKTEEDKRIIDIEIESLVVIMEALDALDDEYAIFGFSGSGRDKVDFYLMKDFCDPYSEMLKSRISGIRPKESTRMGTAIRHATGKLKAVESDQRLLIVLSDGYPQDHDYGEDRSSEEYGLHDTMMALLEAKREGIRPFCITVDQSGNDYLRKMCDPSNYLVIKDTHSLPEILPKVVESLMV